MSSNSRDWALIFPAPSGRPLNALPANPLIYSVRERRRQVRWVIPPRFPYRIVYRVTGDSILVVAVIHAARSEQTWKERL